jgi:metal-dependent amidase/aminoacylase/carboxypeptidase family protein
MDALPITEETGLAFASTVRGWERMGRDPSRRGEGTANPVDREMPVPILLQRVQVSSKEGIEVGVPIMMFRLGAVAGKRLERDRQLGRPPSLHSATFYPDVEATLVTGVTAMASAVLDLMKP